MSSFSANPGLDAPDAPNDEYDDTSQSSNRSTGVFVRVGFNPIRTVLDKQASTPAKRARSPTTEPLTTKPKKMRAKSQSSVDKENNAAAAIDTDPILASRGIQWTKSEKTMFFEWILGPDSEQSKRFEIHKKNPTRIYVKVSDLPYNY